MDNNTERLLAVMLAIAVVLSVITFIDGYTREQARLEMERQNEQQRDNNGHSLPRTQMQSEG